MNEGDLERPIFNVLIVDDTPLNVRVLQRALMCEGYQTLVAYNGREARYLAAKHMPDLILLDIVMPEENGFETLRQLKSNPATQDIPVIFISGDDQVETKVSGLDAGAVDYITKPFHLDEVKARVRLHLRLAIATHAMLASQAQKLKQIREAQTSLLTQPADHPDARFGAVFESLLEAGGDFYEVVPIGDRIYSYFLADVAGHDIATGFLTAALKVLLKQNCTPLYQPAESMRMINRVLLEILPSGKYLTAAYLLLNRQTGTATIVNMAHPPVIYQPVDQRPRLIEIRGDVLGAFGEVTFESVSLQVEPGDRFFMFSDGLLERIGARTVWTATISHIVEMIARLADYPIQDACDNLSTKAKERFGPVDDDLIVLGVQV